MTTQPLSQPLPARFTHPSRIEIWFSEYSVNLVENTFNFLIYLDRLKWYDVRKYIKDTVFYSASNISSTDTFTFYFYVIRRWYSWTAATEFAVPCVKGKHEEFVQYFDAIRPYIFQKFWPHYCKFTSLCCGASRWLPIGPKLHPSPISVVSQISDFVVGRSDRESDTYPGIRIVT